MSPTDNGRHISEGQAKAIAWVLGGRDAAGDALDVGAGSGDFSRLLASNPCINRIYAVDLVNNAPKDIGINFVSADVSQDEIGMPECFDCAFAIEVLEHLENPRHALREIYKSLRPGGFLVVTTPSVVSLASRISYLLRAQFPPFCEHSYRETGHITPISEIELKRMASESGFEQIKVSFMGSGRMPGTALRWPWRGGRLFVDTMAATMIKP